MFKYSIPNKSKELKVQFHVLNDSKYQDVWDFQTVLHNKLKSDKRLFGINQLSSPLNHLIFCEHKPVYTLGKSAKSEHLLIDKSQLNKDGFELFPINRGGDITYHGPGQLTGYLVLDLELLYRDVHRYVRNIEEAIIRLLDAYDIGGIRIEEYTGVWVKRGPDFLKVCAIGVHLSRWVSMHGFALNLNTNLSHFDNILPCGIADQNKKVTSLSQLLGSEVNTKEVQLKLKQILSEVFNFKIIN